MNKLRLLFRETGHVIRTRREWNWWTVGLAVALLLAVYAAAAVLDAHADDGLVLQERARQAAFEEGRRAGHAEMIATAEAAWQAAHMVAGARCARDEP
ncbi:MAG: hypothetical protein KF683_04970 [Rubrivivax sp.]|nr:hypothetical protein [Rubrivivax sp.]